MIKIGNITEIIKNIIIAIAERCAHLHDMNPCRVNEVAFVNFLS